MSSEEMSIEQPPMESALDEMQALFEALEEAELDTTNINYLNKDLSQEYSKLLLIERNDETAMKIKEATIYKLARLFTQGKRFTDVMKLLKENNDFFGAIPKARTAKIVRSIIDIVAYVPDSLEIQITLCKEVIEWCKLEKRTFLRQRVEAKLAALLLQQKDIKPALDIVNSLLGELKKLDDKQMLTETHLTEARIHLALENIPKSKAALTSSRSAATSIYVFPVLQAEIDELSGLLQCEENDYTTAYSYFLEAFEAFDQSSDKRALKCICYMALSKILAGVPEEVHMIMIGKNGLKYSGKELEAMSQLAKAAKARSLEDFKQVLGLHSSYLQSDDLISRKIDFLYNSMLEANLIKIISPYSCVEISHIAKFIKLPSSDVEKKLSQMILDRKFSGILDQGKGHLIVYDRVNEDQNLQRGLDIISNMSKVVSALSERGKMLTSKSISSSDPPADENKKTTGTNSVPSSPSKPSSPAKKE